MEELDPENRCNWRRIKSGATHVAIQFAMQPMRRRCDPVYSTLQLFFPSHPPYNSKHITDTQGLWYPSVLDCLSKETFLFPS